MALPINRRAVDDEASEHLGEIQNVLGLLSPDFNHFFPKSLVKVCGNVTDLADMLGVNRTQLYDKQIPLKKGSKLRTRLIQLVIATDLAHHLLGQSKIKTLRWSMTPNLLFFGNTPLEVIARDEGDAVISWLMEREGLKPGSAF